MPAAYIPFSKENKSLHVGKGGLWKDGTVGSTRNVSQPGQLHRENLSDVTVL